jgi:hypothetical protein
MSYYQTATPAVEPLAEPAPGPATPPPAPGGRRRARVPAGAGSGTPGAFVGDDSATPADEAWENA